MADSAKEITAQLLERAMQAHSTGCLDEAKLCYLEVLNVDPNCLLAMGWLGTIEALTGNYSIARPLLETACSDGNNPSFLMSYANLLFEAALYDEALPIYLKVIEKRRCNVSFTNLAACFHELGYPAEAVYYADRALEIDSNYVEALNIMGNALTDSGRPQEALTCFKQAIDLSPRSATTWFDWGNTLFKLHRYSEAMACYQQSVKYSPEFAPAWCNLGNTQRCLKKYREALDSYRRATDLDLTLRYALGNLVHMQMKICDWSQFTYRCELLARSVSDGNLTSHPFPLLAAFDRPELHKLCAESYATQSFSKIIQVQTNNRAKDNKKIRIGYFSMDFREHAVSRLVAGLIECHDRSNFEVFGFSFGAKSNDCMHNRIKKSFDKFFDLEEFKDEEIAALAREQGVDVAIDLGGYTRGSRSGIFSYRAAPVQVSYLGYPGTLGSSSIDYIIADTVLIPHGMEAAYSEKVIYLPNSYQATDSKREVPSRKFTRQDVGLPETGFVYCCFNGSWKIHPETFDIWIRILNSVPNSVLWLYDDNPLASKNLKEEAYERGLSSGRLIFGEHMSQQEHLARLQLADLFLDTFPYGAHTTASDALWVGLPVVTRMGRSFASRVAGSLLCASGLSDLITHNAEQYESLAIELGRNTNRVTTLKEYLHENRAKCALFNTLLFTRHIESTYRIIYNRYRAGLRPEHLYPLEAS